MADPNAAGAGGPPAEGGAEGAAAAGRPKNKRLDMAQAQVDEVLIPISVVFMLELRITAEPKRVTPLREKVKMMLLKETGVRKWVSVV